MSTERINMKTVEICAKYESGLTTTAIARQYGVNPETIRRRLISNGIKMRESRQSLAAKLNEDFFAQINDEIRAYWLGYLVADACIGKSAGDRRSFRFFVAEKDACVIQSFAKDIDYQGMLRTPDVARGQWGIVFNSKIFCMHLIDKGYLDWKNDGSPRLIEHVPPHFIGHFIRGLFDGDGCISSANGKHYFNIVAHKNHLAVMQEIECIIAKSVGLEIKGVKNRRTCLCVGWNGNKQVKRFGEWLYCDATRFLMRKKRRFDRIYDGHMDYDAMSIKQVDVDVYVPFFNKHHYLGVGGRRGYVLGAHLDGELVAAAMIGSITRAEMATKQGHDPCEVRELARFCIHPDHQHKNFATWFLSRVVKRYSSEHPTIKLLISFADATQGHDGTIYRAANWKYDGETSKSYHYVDALNHTYHKKTIYGLAAQVGMTESQYAVENNLTKVKHKSKKRFLFNL